MGPLRLSPIPGGFEQITSVVTTGTAASLTPPAGAQVALIQATKQNVNWRDDGNPPTSSEGMQLTAGDEPYEYYGPLGQIQFMGQQSGGILSISYYRIAG